MAKAQRKFRGKSVIFDLNIPDSKLLRMGNSDDVTAQWDSAKLTIQPAADDTVIEVGLSGSSQKSFDLKVYGNAAGGADQILWDASASKLTLVGAAEIDLARHTRFIQWKGTSYTVLASDTGKIFATNSANAAVVFTLPVKASGLYYTFFNASDQGMTVGCASGSADEIIGFNDIDLDDVNFESASRQIGGAFTMVCDGSKWLCMPNYWNTDASTAGSLITVTD